MKQRIFILLLFFCFLFFVWRLAVELVSQIAVELAIRDTISCCFLTRQLVYHDWHWTSVFDLHSLQLFRIWMIHTMVMHRSDYGAKLTFHCSPNNMIRCFDVEGTKKHQSSQQVILFEYENVVLYARATSPLLQLLANSMLWMEIYFNDI